MKPDSKKILETIKCFLGKNKVKCAHIKILDVREIIFGSESNYHVKFSYQTGLGTEEKIIMINGSGELAD